MWRNYHYQEKIISFRKKSEKQKIKKKNKTSKLKDISTFDDENKITIKTWRHLRTLAKTKQSEAIKQLFSFTPAHDALTAFHFITIFRQLDRIFEFVLP